MTYQSDETISLTKVADSNLPKEESSSRRKWLAAVAAALIVGGGTMVVSSSSSNTNGGTLSSIRSQALQSVVHTDIDSGLPWCSPIHKYGKCPGKNQCCATDFNDHGYIYCGDARTSTGDKSPNCNANH